MSRRSRKRRGSGGGGRAGRVVLIVLVLAAVVVVGVYGSLRVYLHSDGFRKFLSAEAGKAAGVDGEFAPFRWDGLSVRTEGFQGGGVEMIQSLRAEGLVTEVSLGGVKRGVWELHETEVSRLEVEMDLRKDQESAVPDGQPGGGAVGKTHGRGWLPSRVEVHGLDVRRVEVTALTDKGAGTAAGMSVRAEREGPGEVYRAEVSGGTIRLPQDWLPEVRLADARLRYRDGSVFLIGAELRAWNEGRLEVSGEWSRRADEYALGGTARGIKAAELLNEDWSHRLTGDISSTFTIDGRGASPRASGSLRMENGVLTALPVLDALAAYADTRRFRVLTLSESRTDWRWRDGELILTDLVMASEGLVRVEGTLTIRGRELDGIFRLGLAPGTLSRIPGAETEVFMAGERGLLWAPVRITGTLDDPREDLTDRLIKAAGMRMFEQIPETGERVLKFTRSVFDEAAPRAVETGVKILGEGEKIIRGAEGVLDGILGRPQRGRDEP
jgi:hypothetical protein